jgi:hypothetical protein
LKKNQKFQDLQDQYCWICDGWNQQQFSWPGAEQPVYLHLEVEAFEGKYIGTDNTIGKALFMCIFKREDGSLPRDILLFYSGRRTNYFGK